MYLFELLVMPCRGHEQGSVYFYHNKLGVSMRLKDAEIMFKQAVKYAEKNCVQGDRTEEEHGLAKLNDVKEHLALKGFKIATVKAIRTM